jgi:ubiquinone/menaquinone biosynthesis C-methylase UbiE
MAAYDVFLKNKHSDSIKQLMVKNNKRLLKYLIERYFGKVSRKISFLEVGPGKGYMHQAIMNEYSDKVEYYALDRNKAILDNLHIDREHVILGGVSSVEIKNKKFDVIFVGYVIEHMNNGIELYNTIENLKRMLNKDGIVVLLFPDCMKLGMEFYNIDYTHMFPTTKRNVNQVVIDNGMYVDKSIDINGILYCKRVDSIVSYKIKRIIWSLYNYRFFNGMASIIYKVPIWDLNNVFWRAYGMMKEPNVMFVLKINET